MLKWSAGPGVSGGIRSHVEAPGWVQVVEEESLRHETAYNLCFSVFLVLFAGFASGMTVGLLSIDPIQLRVLQEEGNEEEKRQAHKVEKVLSQHHLLLVTLLLANSIAMEALPIFLNRTVPEWAAILLSVTAILLFGEILPQALCTGRFQMPIVMSALPLVDFLMAAFFVLSWPIARLLDVVLGHSSQTFYARSHLKALIRLHQREKRAQLLDGHTAPNVSYNELDAALGADEVVVIEGALDLATKTTSGIMVPIDQVYMLEWNTLITDGVRKTLLEKGHSRVPIYKGHRDNIKGLLLVKTLIAQDSHITPRVGDLLKATKPPIFCSPDLQLYDLLNEFQRGRHMAFVTRQPDYYKAHWGIETSDIPRQLEPQDRQLLGIATLEDVIEELIQEEIYDEFDNYASQVAPLSAQIGDVRTIARVENRSRRSSQEALVGHDGPRGQLRKVKDVVKVPTRDFFDLTLRERLIEDDSVKAQSTDKSTDKVSPQSKRADLPRKPTLEESALPSGQKSIRNLVGMAAARQTVTITRGSKHLWSIPSVTLATSVGEPASPPPLDLSNINPTQSADERIDDLVFTEA